MDYKKEFLHLIIGGTTRGGTTALFKYLSSHPDICASSLKETRFFLDASYPIPVRYRHGDYGVDKYLEYFHAADEKKILLEATPDYLYSIGTPEKVQKVLSNVKWVFILRDPISRLKSWYCFAKQVGELVANTSFDEYVRIQFSEKRAHTKQIFRVLEQGLYSKYIPKFIDVFGKRNVLIISYDEFLKHPQDVVRKVCSFSGIESKFYQGYQFEPHNKKRAFKNYAIQKFYSRSSESLYFMVYDKPTIRRIFRFIKTRMFEPFYYYLNEKSFEDVEMSKENREILSYYYHDERIWLSGVFER